MKTVELIKALPVSKENYLQYIYDKIINSKNKLSDLVDTSNFWKKLVYCYQQPVAKKVDRSYHTLAHINDGINLFVSIEDPSIDLSLPMIAWFYHDVIYKFDKKMAFDNEKASAEYAFSDLIEMGWSGENAGKVYDLIMLTKHNKEPAQDDLFGQLIVDIDLHSLAVSPVSSFFENTKKVRAEFIQLSNDEWNKGRLDFWNRLLLQKKGKIYKSKQFEHLNDIALDNIQKEKFSLQREK